VGSQGGWQERARKGEEVTKMVKIPSRQDRSVENWDIGED
jgi:hypothetical protein